MVKWMTFFRRDPPAVAKPPTEAAAETKPKTIRKGGAAREGKGARAAKERKPAPITKVDEDVRKPPGAPVPAKAEAVEEIEEVTRLTLPGMGVPALPKFLIQSASLTHEGKVRTRNEDSFIVRDDAGLWSVADGMGGHEGGEWASARIVGELGRIDTGKGFEASCAAAADAVRVANEAILAEARERGKQMGSTVVTLIVDGSHYAVQWVGDSRAYLLRDSRLTQLSRDHSQVQEMVDRGLMTAEQAVGHPMGHILSRAVGVRDEVSVDQVVGEVRPGDVFLLCSDGLYGYVDESDIDGLLSREAPDRALKQLIDMTLDNGAPDNVTGITIWASEPTLLSFADSR
jgi:serine/threonine protein phosphatase PrpC